MDSVFVVMGQGPASVEESLTTLLGRAGFDAARPGGAEELVFVDRTGQRPPVEVALRRDRFGTFVSVVGLGEAGLDDRAVAELAGVVAMPPVGPRVHLPDPPTTLAVLPGAARHAASGSQRSMGPRHDEADDASETRPVARRAFALRFDDGATVPLTGRMVLGRDPSAGSAGAEVSVVALADPDRTLSKTHFAVEVRAGQVLVQDLGSTNGTRHVDGTGVQTDLVPRTPVAVAPGDSLRVGSRWAVLEAG